MRKIAEFENESIGKSAKVYWDSEWQEYVVKFWINGGYCPIADYHCNDKQDALGTAQVNIGIKPDRQ
jgi:hypothetical protein